MIAGGPGVSADRGTSATRRIDAPDATAGAAQETLAQWLLHGPAQVRSGPHAGAVAGTIDRSGEATYAYPEITGYYLQWLAWRAATHGATKELALRAEAAQRWLARWLNDPAAPAATRIALVTRADDWRNGALFFFDLAMVLRGLGTAARAALIVPDRAIVDGLCEKLQRLIAEDGQFDACIAVRPDVALPQRWSTGRGGFLAKAAAGVLSAAAVIPEVAESVRMAAARTFEASVRSAAATPHDDVHALMYTFEGMVNRPDAEVRPLLPEMAMQFDGLLTEAQALGRIPESRRDGGAMERPERVDVLAQTIRIGHLLGALCPDDPPDRVGIARLSQTLVASIRPEGSVPFALPGEPASCNVWAAMFAEQALGFSARRDGAPGVADLCRLLV